MKLNRRQFFALLGIGAAGGGYSFFVEPEWMRFKDYHFTSPKWPKEAKPLRIAYASDFHVGCPSVGMEEMAHVVEKINALDADIILLGGDYLSHVLLGQTFTPEEIAAVFAPLSAPLGVYSVLGNHDWWRADQGMALWTALEANGVKVLENSAVKITQDGFSFWLSGMADDSTRTPDYSKAMSFVADDDPVIMLAHDPASFMEIGERPVLTICGHTHGGQVVIPYISPIVIPGRAPLKYAYGHIQEQGRDMIVSSGLGTSVLPVRFGRRPEILTIEVGYGEAL